MSASVFKPICREMPRLRTQTPIDRGSVGKDFPKVRRALFGVPDLEETRRMLDVEIERQRRNASMKWNFDFLREVPLNPEGKYVWSTATPTHEKCKRPGKRSSFEEEDNLHLYCDLTEDLRNANEVEDEENMLVSPIRHTRQPLITEYLVETKPSMSTVKKLKEHINPRPAKIARTSSQTTTSSS